MGVLIYRGKMEWEGYASKEEFTVILPYGTCRLGDPIHLYWQWTKVDSGDTKVNVLARTTITGITLSTVDGEIKFSCVHGNYYSFDITSKNYGSSLSIYMSNPAGYTSKEMVLNKFSPSRVLTAGDYTLNPERPRTRIYAGKLNWYQYAVNELFIVILPDGFGDGYPASAHWQWTVTGSGDKQINCDANDQQRYTSDDKDENHFYFMQGGYYTLSCVADEDASTLTVTMSNPKGESQGSTTLQLQELINTSSDADGTRRKRAAKDHTTTIVNDLPDVVVCTFSPTSSSASGKILAVGGFGMALVGFVPTILTTLPTPFGWAVAVAGAGVAILGCVDVAIAAGDPTTRPLFPGDIASNTSSGATLISSNNVLILRAYIEKTSNGSYVLVIRSGTAGDVGTVTWNLTDTTTDLKWSDYFRFALAEQYHIESYRGIPIRRLQPNWDGEAASDSDIGMTPDQYALYSGLHDQDVKRYGLTIKSRQNPKKRGDDKKVLFNCVSADFSFTLTQRTTPNAAPAANLGDYRVHPLKNGNISVRVEKSSIKIKQGNPGIRPFITRKCYSEDEVYEAITNNPGYFAYEWSTHTWNLYCWMPSDADQVVEDDKDNVYFVVPGVGVKTAQFMLKGAPSS
ncbi:hypothetical protein GGR50DRAFT_598786 [Xylaria sp. CBS 124048]|nr:hypothetical protein GGR50DRAFT_598786 [Xylaria sp. CBS 124048]